MESRTLALGLWENTAVLRSRELSSDLPGGCLCAFCFICSEIKPKFFSVVSLGLKEAGQSLADLLQHTVPLSKGSVSAGGFSTGSVLLLAAHCTFYTWD